MFNHGYSLPYGFPSGSVGKSSGMLEIDPLPVVLPPVTLPAVIFPDIVALSLVVCASTKPMTLSPDTDRVVCSRENGRYSQYCGCVHWWVPEFASDKFFRRKN